MRDNKQQIAQDSGTEMYRAGPPSPGARLLAAACLVRAGVAVADIGCDHGKLAVWLAMKNICPRVVAIDSRPLPLARARALVKQTGCAARVDCRLGDGLAPLRPGEVQDIVVAGMSGQTITEIISRAQWAQSAEYHFVFVPATRQAHLRRWLCMNGFSIRSEKPVEDNRRFYTALSVEYTGAAHVPTDFFCETGLVAQAGGRAAKGYLAGRVAHLQKQLNAPMDSDARQRLATLIQEVEKCQL